MEASAPNGLSPGLLFVPLFAFVSSVSSVPSSSGKLPALLVYSCRLQQSQIISLPCEYDVVCRQADDVKLRSRGPERPPDRKDLTFTHQEV